MPQMCDMGPTALLPLRSEGVLRIFSPLKIRRLRPGLNPRTWVQKGSMLLLDHRSCSSSPIQVSQEECARLRESVPHVKLYRYNPKHLYPKLNGYRDNGHRKVWASGVSTYCTPSVTPYSSTVHARQRDTTS